MDRSLSEFFEKMGDNLNVLCADVQRISINKREELKNRSGDKEGTKEKRNMKSLQRITTLRKSVEEVKFAAENPDFTFIKDQLERIIDR